MSSTNALDLFETSHLDQTNTIDADWIMERAEAIVQESVKKKDIEIAVSNINQLLQIARLSGIGLAKILYGIHENRKVFGLEDENEFVDYLYQRIGKDKQTIIRYVKVWHIHAAGVIPPEFQDQIRSINIRDQIPIANALDQGWQFNDEDWKRIAHY